jgi:mannose-6-phosphate isomerase
MNCNYPIKFEPILKEKIWGGTKLNQLFNKASKAPNVGESWEISSVEGAVSVVANGTYKGTDLITLIQNCKGDLLGNKIYKQFGDAFPLLIKFIDAKTDLSIQLHPDDALAQKRHNSFGKTEMWYVMQADKDARLIVGFNQTVNKKLYLEKLNQSKLVSILNSEKVQHGDVFFIPTGRIHAIGGGVLLAEIQQTSDITYRVFDWNRVDEQGNGRALHTDLALDALDFSFQNSYKTSYKQAEKVTLAHCPYFTTSLLTLERTIDKNTNNLDSFVIYMCVKGAVVFSCNENENVVLNIGETVLIPAHLKQYSIKPLKSSELLEVFIK